MRTAPPVFSPLTCAICLKFLDDSVIARAYLFCRLPTLPLVCFSAPIPPTPFPSGEGGGYKLILPGASPPAPRHQTVYGTDSPCRCSTRRGTCPLCHLPPLPVACFSAPFPTGRGIYSFLMQGAPPLASPRLSRKRHGLNLRGKCPEGARFLCCLPTLPLVFVSPPSTLPALAERSSQWEGGETISLFCRGLRPLHPRT